MTYIQNYCAPAMPIFIRVVLSMTFFLKIKISQIIISDVRTFIKYDNLDTASFVVTEDFIMLLLLRNSTKTTKLSESSGFRPSRIQKYPVLRSEKQLKKSKCQAIVITPADQLPITKNLHNNLQ